MTDPILGLARDLANELGDVLYSHRTAIERDILGGEAGTLRDKTVGAYQRALSPLLAARLREKLKQVGAQLDGGGLCTDHHPTVNINKSEWYRPVYIIDAEDNKKESE